MSYLFFSFVAVAVAFFAGRSWQRRKDRQELRAVRDITKASHDALAEAVDKNK